MDNSLDLDLAMEVADFFRLSSSKANEIIAQITSTVKNWRNVARLYGLSKAEQERMAPAFE